MGLFSGKEKLRQGRYLALQEMSELFIGLTIESKRRGKERTSAAFTLAFLVISDMVKHDKLSREDQRIHIERILNDYAFSIVGSEAIASRDQVVEQDSVTGRFDMFGDASHLCNVEDYPTEVFVSNQEITGDVRD